MDIIDKIDLFLGEEGEGAGGATSTPGTTTPNIAKVPMGTKKMYKKKKKKLDEQIILDVNVGDVILGGKFKNKRIVVKEIGKNEKGDVTINGKSMMRFRIIPKDQQP